MWGCIRWFDGATMLKLYPAFDFKTWATVFLKTGQIAPTKMGL